MTDRTSSDGLSADRASSNRTSSDRTSSNRTSNDRTSSDRTSSNRTSNDRTSSDRTSNDRTSNDRTSSDRTSSDRTSNDRTSSDPRTIDRRAFLASGTAVASLGLAGCLGIVEDGTPDDEPPRDDRGWVTLWNQRYVEAIQTGRGGNFGPTRQGALLNLSIFDAVNAITAARDEPHYEPYLDDLPAAPAEASRSAAGATAAYEVLDRLFPLGFEDTYEHSMERAAELGGDLNAGEEWGRSVVDRLWEERVGDGEYRSDLYQACPDEPDAPGCFRGGWSSERAFVRPWTIEHREQFRPDGPPDLESEAYAEDWQEVYEYGRDRDDRPQEEVDVATFWRGASGSPRPPNMWNVIARAVSGDQDLRLLDNARLFGLLHLALADAAISSAEAKHHFGFWRPRTAIQQADRDGNPATTADPDWEPLAVGGSPEYPAGLACFGGAGCQILETFFDGDDYAFEIGSDVYTGLHGDEYGVNRSFESFSEARDESADSRIYVGNHFRFALDDAIDVGERIADWVLEHELQPVE